jgi:hypothetical protein
MKILMLIPILLISFLLKAQENNFSTQFHQPPIPAEVMVGGKSTMYQMIVNKRFAPGSRFKFFNLINYEVDYDGQTPDNYIIQTIGYYEFAKGFDVGAGGNLKAFGGFKPVVSVEYTHFSREFGIVIQPVYEVHKDGEFSTMALFEWHPVNDKKLQPYFSVQALTAWTDVHSFSYHNWRVGAQYKILRFGPAVNFQYHGENVESSVNWGGFVNVVIM